MVLPFLSRSLPIQHLEEKGSSFQLLDAIFLDSPSACGPEHAHLKSVFLYPSLPLHIFFLFMYFKKFTINITESL